MKNFLVPKTKRQLRGFLGLTSYFRKFVKNYSMIAKPLTDKLKESVKLNISPDEVKAIELLKRKLISEPILNCMIPTKK